MKNPWVGMRGIGHMNNAPPNQHLYLCLSQSLVWRRKCFQVQVPFSPAHKIITVGAAVHPFLSSYIAQQFVVQEHLWIGACECSQQTLQWLYFQLSLLMFSWKCILHRIVVTIIDFCALLQIKLSQGKPSASFLTAKNTYLVSLGFFPNFFSWRF